MCEFNKVVAHKINRQKSIVFVYIVHKRKLNLKNIALKIIKYLRVNLAKCKRLGQ